MLQRVVAFVLVLAFSAGALPQPAQAQGAPPLVVLARAHVTITADGLFAIDSRVSGKDREALSAVFAPLNVELSRVARHLRLAAPSTSTKGPGLNAPAASICVGVPLWALEAFAWYVIIVGGYEAIVGLFLDATIFGLPAGAVIGAIGLGTGITGSFLLWYVDNYLRDGVYVCIF